MNVPWMFYFFVTIWNPTWLSTEIIIPDSYVLINTHFLLALLDHMTCDYFWQYDLWWSHYWSCDRYALAILTPSKKQNVCFHRLNFKKHDLSCSDGFSPSSIKINFKIGIW